MDKAVVGIHSKHVNPVLHDFADVFVQQSQNAYRCRDQQDALRELEDGDQKDPSVIGKRNRFHSLVHRKKPLTSKFVTLDFQELGCL